MISFEVLSENSAECVLQNLRGKCPESDGKYISEITKELLSSNDGCEYALSVVSGCLLVRVFDGEYFFLFPEPVADRFELTAAVEELRVYTIREEIPLVICEVPGEYLESLSALFANAEAECEDEEEDIYTVRALSEIALSEEIPTVSDGGMELAPLSSSDEGKYALLCRDDETNKYWGYNYSDDYPDCPDSWFIECAEAELSRGVAASFAVKLSGEFIGEALLYAFDLLGGAECAVRFLPEYRGKSLSARCLELLCRAAKQLGLRRLYATVDDRNEISKKLFSKSFNVIEKDKIRTRFLREM